MKALGMIETRGHVGSVQAVDTMIKSADVQVVGVKEVGDGYVSVYIEGDIGAVKSAVDSAAEEVKKIGQLVSVHVIARPSPETLALIHREGGK